MKSEMAFEVMIDDSDDDKNLRPRSWIEKLTALLAGEPQNREQLMEILRDAEENELLSSEMLSMIERIVQVSEMQVREVMVPRSQMVYIDKDVKLDKIINIVIESGHSRFPVFSDEDNCIGILLAKDLLKKSDQEIDLNNILRPVFFTSLSKRLDILLREFRINRNHMAIVLDEYGKVAGLVTIEDVLEQIVGEIEDEYDIEEEDAHIKKLADGTSIVKAITTIDEFNDFFNTNFRDDEFDTIGGIVLQAFGHLPRRNEIIKLENLRFKVLNCDNRRIYLLEVKPSKKK